MKKLWVLVFCFIITGSLSGQVLVHWGSDQLVEHVDGTLVFTVPTVYAEELEIPPLDHLGNVPRVERSPNGGMVPYCSLHRGWRYQTLTTTGRLDLWGQDLTFTTNTIVEITTETAHFYDGTTLTGPTELRIGE